MSKDRSLEQWDRNDILEAAILGGLIAAHKGTKDLINWYLSGADKDTMPDYPIDELFTLAKNLSTDAISAKSKSEP